MAHDIRVAVRLFLRERGLFSVTLASLAFAIGVSTAVFTVLNASTLRGHGVTDPAAIYRLSLDNRLTGPASRGAWMTGVWAYDDSQRLARLATSMFVAASAPSGGALRATGAQPVDLPFAHISVSGTFFTVMGVNASLGRVLQPSDDEPGAMPAIVLGYTFWMQAFHGDRSVVGQTVWLDDIPLVIVGIGARFFAEPNDGGAPPGWWISMAVARELERARDSARVAATMAKIEELKVHGAMNATDRERLRTLEALQAAPTERWNPPVTIYARPAAGTSRAQLNADIVALATAFATERGQRIPTDRPAVALESLQERQLKQARGARNMLLMVAGAIGLVILLASANLANLLLAGAMKRGREIATRLALGAGRWRVVRQLLTESVLLGLAGGAGGFLIATWLAPLFARLGWGYPERLDLAPDLTTYLFVTGVSVAIGIAAGLAPARHSRRGDLVSGLKADQAGSSGLFRRGFLRSVLLGGQAAVSIVLLVVAALLTRAAVRASTFDLGFAADRLLEVSVGLGGGYDQARIDAYWRTALDRIRHLPGVAAAAVTDSQPFGALGAEPWQGGRVGLRERTSAEYFEAAGIRLLHGRTYSADEVRDHEPVAIISASVASLYWGSEDPLGAGLERVWGAPDKPGVGRGGIMRKPAGTRVIGVVADTITDLAAYDAPTIYMPSETLHANTQLIVRSTRDPADLIGPVREALRRIDPEQHPGFHLVRDRFQKQLAEPQRVAALSAIIGVTALGLVAVGLFSVTAFVAGQRRYEMGVRTALGAERRDLVRMLVGDSLRPVVVGIGCGMVGALWSGRIVQSSLFGVSGWDPLAIVAGVGILIATAVAAAYWPARQAARVDPVKVLRAD